MKFPNIICVLQSHIYEMKGTECRVPAFHTLHFSQRSVPTRPTKHSAYFAFTLKVKFFVFTITTSSATHKDERGIVATPLEALWFPICLPSVQKNPTCSPSSRPDTTSIPSLTTAEAPFTFTERIPVSFIG